MKFFITCHLASLGASMSLFQGQLYILKLQLVQPMIYDYIPVHYYSVSTAKPTLASQVLLNSWAQTLNETQSIKRSISIGEWKATPVAFSCCPQLAIPHLDISGFLKCDGYKFIFSKKERHLLDRKAIITFMIFVSVQIHCMWWS